MLKSELAPSDGQVTQSFISSGVVAGDPHPAPEGDTPGTAQALPHEVLHFYTFGIAFYSCFWLLLGSPGTIRALSIILRYSVSIWDTCQGLLILSEVCHALLSLP